MSIGAVFGPIMLVWFATLGILGAWYVLRAPGVLRALNPPTASRSCTTPRPRWPTLLGSIVLAITGAEALYADMGHFGRRAITIAWYGVAFPGLVLNYFGQVAYLLSCTRSPTRTRSSRWRPRASRARAHRDFHRRGDHRQPGADLGRVLPVPAGDPARVLPAPQDQPHERRHSGQIYVPFVNMLLAIGCILTVLLFRLDRRLASAYGIAVTGTMAITTGAYFMVARRNWKWPLWKAGPICGLFLVIDLGFFAANARKLADGGWYPLDRGGHPRRHAHLEDRPRTWSSSASTAAT
jgi:KUP system potassium uptake protein